MKKKNHSVVDSKFIVKWLSERFPERKAFDFYRDIFPVDSFEKPGVFEEGKYNGIIIEIEDDGKICRHTLTDELSKIDKVSSRDNFCLISPISYIGKSRKSANAREIYALAIDLDGVKTKNGFDFLMAQIERGEKMMAFVWGLPRPTYIVSSGTGLHLYYVFETPLRLFPNVVKELEKLKQRLTWQAWTQGASELYDHVQYESLFQGFRVVGTKTKVGTRTRAFCVGEKVTVEYLNRFIPEDFRAQSLIYTSRLSLEEAREKYPDWYQKRIVEGIPRSTWRCKRDLYEWWKRKMLKGAEQGHRYWCVMTLAVYAKKSGVEYDNLLADAVNMIDFLNSIGDGSDPFTISDAMDALKAYDDAYLTYPIKAIIARTGIQIKKNKRNFQNQIHHLEEARAVRDIRQKRKGKNWWDNGGRPLGSGTKKELVEEYRLHNPHASQREIAAALGISKTTVNKWLNQ